MCLLQQYHKQMKAIMCCLFPLSQFSGLFWATGIFSGFPTAFFFLVLDECSEKPKKPSNYLLLIFQHIRLLKSREIQSRSRHVAF